MLAQTPPQHLPPHIPIGTASSGLFATINKIVPVTSSYYKSFQDKIEAIDSSSLNDKQILNFLTE